VDDGEVVWREVPDDAVGVQGAGIVETPKVRGGSWASTSGGRPGVTRDKVTEGELNRTYM